MSSPQTGHVRPAEPQERVLSTLNADGSRRRIDLKLIKGRFFARRRALGYSLIILFCSLPYVQIGGKPAILLDLPQRQLTLFGTTFLPTDTVLLMLLGVAIVITVFLLTALFGRLWCGWACPQTVYLELVFRPLERLIVGSASERRQRSTQNNALRRALKLAVYFALATFLAHTFLAYFVGARSLLGWLRGSPIEHPAAFLSVLVVTVLIFTDFAWFREQCCIVACPYGRLQSVLLDRYSVIVGYDEARGEPRGKATRGKAKQGVKLRRDGGDLGDCVDCRACNRACPTGIDIREGLQLECVGCTQCIDACDAIMSRLDRPRGLIRYSSRAELQGEPRRMLRPRVIIYPAILFFVLGLLGFAASRKGTADVTLLRRAGSPYAALDGGKISNSLRVKVVNRSGDDRRYTIEVLDADDARVVAPLNPLPVSAGEAETAVLFVIVPRASFEQGRRPIRLRISDGEGFVKTVAHRLLGPG